jgi:hypothetical protein
MEGDKKMGQHFSADVYDIFEQAFHGKEHAKKVLYALEEVIVDTVHDTWYKTKEELKAEVFSHYATKQDLEQVRTELVGKFDGLYQKTEKDKAELIGALQQTREELLGIIKQNKEELLGIMKQDKAELLGIMKEDKAELLGKFDALYEKTEKDKAELLGKFDALYEKTEKDKAELLGIMKQDKAELLGIMKQDKAELIGALQQTREELLGIIKQNKEELLGIMKQDKAELLGKFDALYEKTEKDKAEINLRIERLDKKFSFYFAALFFIVIFLNQNALEFIAKVIGLVK